MTKIINTNRQTEIQVKLSKSKIEKINRHNIWLHIDLQDDHRQRDKQTWKYQTKCITTYLANKQEA